MPAKRVAVKKTARKSAAKTATAKKTAAKTTSTRPRVRIRTYRHGLGDCHLLSFRKPDGKQFHMLIDFGVVNRTKDPELVMTPVAKDIAKESGGVLDLVVVHVEHIPEVLLDGDDAREGPVAVVVGHAGQDRPRIEVALRGRGSAHVTADVRNGVVADLGDHDALAVVAGRAGAARQAAAPSP